MDILEIMKTRRSVRKYRTDPVADADLDKILEAARWAPSWANTQCWRFVVVKKAAVKERLAGTLLGISKNEDGSIKPNRAADAIKQAPVTIVACAELERSGYKKQEKPAAATDKGDWYMFDVALAMQNLVLMAHTLGLGTVYIGAFDAVAAARILDVPPGFDVVAMTPLGYPDETAAAGTRKELGEIVFRERFGGS